MHPPKPILKWDVHFRGFEGGGDGSMAYRITFTPQTGNPDSLVQRHVLLALALV